MFSGARISAKPFYLFYYFIYCTPQDQTLFSPSTIIAPSPRPHSGRLDFSPPHAAVPPPAQNASTCAATTCPPGLILLQPPLIARPPSRPHDAAHLHAHLRYDRRVLHLDTILFHLFVQKMLPCQCRRFNGIALNKQIVIYICRQL